MLEQQVRRMLADPKSDALVRNFTGQWLGVRSLAASEPVVNLFPDFDDNLRDAYQREIELFFGAVVHEDRSVLDLLDADFTFVNERLAKHYGIPNVYGPHFRRVTLPASLDMRRGLLGKGALMTVTSNAARTSPVTRGKWFLQTFLGVSPPDPPPDVPALRGADRGHHRQHEAADDAAGARTAPREPDVRVVPPDLRADGPGARELRRRRQWRTLDEGQPIDASGILPDGTKVNGVVDLRQSLERYSPQFVQVVAEKLLTYAHRARHRARGHADGAADRARRGGRRLQVLGARAEHRQERHVPDEPEGGRGWRPRSQASQVGRGQDLCF